MRSLTSFIAVTIMAITQQRVLRSQDVDDKRVVCYYMPWTTYTNTTEERLIPEKIDPCICTHLVYAFAKLNNKNPSEIEPFDLRGDMTIDDFKTFIGLKLLNKNLKIMLSVGGWNQGSENFSKLAADSGKRAEFIRNIVEFLREHNFDGLDLSWQYPGNMEDSNIDDKSNYVYLVQELWQEFKEESTKTGNRALLLSIVVSPITSYIDKGYEVPALIKYLDFLNIATYDYYMTPDPFIYRHVKTFQQKEELNEPINQSLNVDSTIKYLLEKGATRNKLNMGISTYGRKYKFNKTEFGSDSWLQGSGISSDEPEFKPYYEICRDLMSGGWTVNKSTEIGPYANKGEVWVVYNDLLSVTRKGKYAKMMGLGGLMLWTLDNDDFRGTCHGQQFPLTSAGRNTIMDHRKKKSTIQVAHPKNMDSFYSQSPSILTSANSLPTTVITSGVLTVISPRPPVINYATPFISTSNISWISKLFPSNVFFQDIKVWVVNNFHNNS